MMTVKEQLLARICGLETDRNMRRKERNDNYGDSAQSV